MCVTMMESERQCKSGRMPRGPCQSGLLCVSDAPRAYNRPSSGRVRPITWILLVITALSHLDMVSSAMSPPPTFTPVCRKFTNGTLYYRYLLLHGEDLYVGAMDHIFRLKASNINQGVMRSTFDSNEFIKNITDGNKDTCRSIGKDEHFECRNHIRAIVVEPSRNLVWACGTGAYHPQDLYLKKDDLTVDDSMRSKMPKRSGSAKCPSDPNVRSAMAVVGETSGNSINPKEIYTATVPDYNKANPIICRPSLNLSNHVSVPLSTLQHNLKWLNGPTFIAAFEEEDYVFIFFHEHSLEHQRFDSPIYPRVARICKNDRGGRGVLEEHWTGYLKARLNCSIPGDYSFYFNKLEDVYYQRSEKRFYGLFTTSFPSAGPNTSAICSFSFDDIVRVFREGDFLEQLDNSKFWTVVPDERKPTPRPGMCNDSQQIPQHVLQFIMARPLMAQSVPSESHKPLHWINGANYRHMQVQSLSDSYTIFFLSTDTGEIHKVGRWMRITETISRVLAIWKPFDASGDTIRQMKLKDDWLYVSSDKAVEQISVKQCDLYTSCTHCIVDPYCEWGEGRCNQLEQYNPSRAMTEDPVEECGSSCKLSGQPYSTYVKMFGDSLMLNCTSYCDANPGVNWTRNGSAVVIDKSRFFLSADSSLIIHNVTHTDSGVYNCSSGDVTFTSHNVHVTECTDPECIWEKEFTQWCAKFEEFQLNYNQWNCMKSECIKDKDCLPEEVKGLCPLG